MNIYIRIVSKVLQHFSNVRKRFILSLLSNKGSNVIIGNYTVIQNPGQLQIGDNTQISDFTILLALNNIVIGKNCRISTSCMISSVTHKIASYNRITDDNVENKGFGIMIGDNVWIGANCVIMPGSIIGNNSIIATASVVKGVIPDDEIWGGSPAVFISKIIFK
jgi:acetyltransferase-like isoleucine patch superfamily enzyme